METGFIQVSRAQKKFQWSCNVIVVAAANNCPCGWLGSKRKLCICPQQKISAYQRKLSGPLLDRFDLRYVMPEINIDIDDKYFSSKSNGQTISLKKRIEAGTLFRNERLSTQCIKSTNSLDWCHQKMFEGNDMRPIIKAFNKLPTRRSQTKLLKVSRTIADLDLSNLISIKHIHQALRWQEAEEI